MEGEDYGDADDGEVDGEAKVGEECAFVCRDGEGWLVRGRDISGGWDGTGTNWRNGRGHLRFRL